MYRIVCYCPLLNFSGRYTQRVIFRSVYVGLLIYTHVYGIDLRIVSLGLVELGLIKCCTCHFFSAIKRIHLKYVLDLSFFLPWSDAFFFFRKLLMSDTYLPGFSAQTPSTLYPTAGLCIPTVFLQTAAFMTINLVSVSADVCVLLPL